MHIHLRYIQSTTLQHTHRERKYCKERGKMRREEGEGGAELKRICSHRETAQESCCMRGLQGG